MKGFVGGEGIAACEVETRMENETVFSYAAVAEMERDGFDACHGAGYGGQNGGEVNANVIVAVAFLAMTAEVTIVEAKIVGVTGFCLSCRSCSNYAVCGNASVETIAQTCEFQQPVVVTRTS